MMNLQSFKKRWRLILILLSIGGLFALFQGYVSLPFQNFSIAGLSLFIGVLAGMSITLKFYQPFMTDSECISLADQKICEIFHRRDYELSGLDIVDTNANAELQKFRGFAPVSGIMWTIRATYPDEKIVQIFGDAKLRKSTTHMEVGEVRFETPLLREVKRALVKYTQPKGGVFIQQPQRIIREEKIKFEVKK